MLCRDLRTRCVQDQDVFVDASGCPMIGLLLKRSIPVVQARSELDQAAEAVREQSESIELSISRIQRCAIGSQAIDRCCVSAGPF